jgi:Domain of unknown function (DUF4157)
VHDVLRSPGLPLESAARSFFEPRFGHDFGNVRIHVDDRAAQSARAVDAEAYTVGSHVVFATSRYQPASEAGQRLIAHELTHVLQQRNAAASGPLSIETPSSHFESQAEANARSLLGGELRRKQPGARRSLQRQTSSESGVTTQFPDPSTLTYDQLVAGLLRIVAVFEKASSTSLELQDIEFNVLPRYVQAFLRVAVAMRRPTTILGLRWGNPAHEKVLRLFPAPQPQPNFLEPPPAPKPTPGPVRQESAFEKFVREHSKELSQLPKWNDNFAEGLKRSDLGTALGESWNEVKANLTSADRGTRFFVGFVTGVPIGAAKDLYSQITQGVEFLLQMFLLNERLKSEPLKVLAELRRFADASASQVISLLDANELGFAIGNQLGKNITAGFVKQDPTAQGRYLGEIAGAIIMEVALLFVGVEEVSAAVKAIRGTRLGRGIGEGMSLASKELRALLEARQVLKTEAKAAGDVAKEAKILEGHAPGELPKSAETPHPAESSKPAAPDPAKPQTGTTAQSKYPQELALGFTPSQIEAGKKFIGKRFPEVPELNFETHWNSGLNADHVRNARAGAAKDQVRGHFDTSREKFWTRVFDDTNGAKKAIEDAGFVFEKRGNAPTSVLPDGQVTSLDVDHVTRLTDNPAIALDSNNLRLIFKRENRTVLEQLRRLEQRQFKPFRPGK